MLNKSLLADDVHATNGFSTPADTGPAKRWLKQGSNASSAGGDPTQFKAAKHVKAYQYDMTRHTEKCVHSYLELAKTDRKTLKRLPRPTWTITNLPQRTSNPKAF